MIRGGRVTFPVANIERAVRFYVETLGVKLVVEAEGSAVLDAGDGFLIELREGPGARAGGVDLHSKLPLAEAVAIYENRGVAFTTDRVGDAAVARFRDPDGNELSLSER